MKDYYDIGFEIIRNAFDPSEIKQEAIRLKNIESANFTYEKDNTIRSLFSPHWYSEIIRNFVYQNPVLPKVKELIDLDLYVHQVHFNYKSAKTGGEYAWHSDYTFWQAHDGMPSDNALSVLFLLDDMTLDNGPLEILEGSHKQYVTKQDQNSWTIAHDATETDGMITEDMVSTSAYKRHTALGKAGDVILMHSNLWHKSNPNTSDFDRNILFVCYNSFNNKTTKDTRPEHIVLRDFSLVP